MKLSEGGEATGIHSLITDRIREGFLLKGGIKFYGGKMLMKKELLPV